MRVSSEEDMHYAFQGSGQQVSQGLSSHHEMCDWFLYFYTPRFGYFGGKILNDLPSKGRSLVVVQQDSSAPTRERQEPLGQAWASLACPASPMSCQTRPQCDV